MKIYVMLTLLLCFTFALSESRVKSKRTLGALAHLLRYGSGDVCEWYAGGCPPWKCQDDSTVIHGYCCGCPGSKYYDNVPVKCVDNLACPVKRQEWWELCLDYDYMIECCCTGP